MDAPFHSLCNVGQVIFNMLDVRVKNLLFVGAGVLMQKLELAKNQKDV
jgi:hypothetical protein